MAGLVTQVPHAAAKTIRVPSRPMLLLLLRQWVSRVKTQFRCLQLLTWGKSKLQAVAQATVTVADRIPKLLKNEALRFDLRSSRAFSRRCVQRWPDDQTLPIKKM